MYILNYSRPIIEQNRFMAVYLDRKTQQKDFKGKWREKCVKRKAHFARHF